MDETLDSRMITGGVTASRTTGGGAATTAEISREVRSALKNIMRGTINARKYVTSSKDRRRKVERLALVASS